QQLRHPGVSTRENLPAPVCFFQVVPGAACTENATIKRSINNGFVEPRIKPNAGKADQSRGTWEQVSKFWIIRIWENPLISAHVVAKEIVRHICVERTRKPSPDAALHKVVLHDVLFWRDHTSDLACEPVPIVRNRVGRKRIISNFQQRG